MRKTEEHCQIVQREIETLQKKVVEIEKLEKQIEDLKSSRDFITGNAIAEAKRKLEKAAQINSKITLLQINPLLQTSVKN